MAIPAKALSGILGTGVSGAALKLLPKELLLQAMGKVSGLAEVESLITSKFASDAARLTEISDYLLELGGKRIRPVLTLLVGELFGAPIPSQPLFDVAAGIELIHMATLLHDDIIDRSPQRRHKVSAYAKFGLSETLLTGDFLLTRAFSLCAHLDRFVIDATEVACVALTEGEILEVALNVQTASVAASLEIARKKTAALFWLAARCGGHLSGAEPAAVHALGRFGESLGIAFQALDDILDVTSTDDQLGKPCGIDIRERKPSLVNVLWLESGSARAKILLTEEPISDAFIAEALTELRSSAVITEASRIARQYAEEARAALVEAASSPHAVGTQAFKKLDALIEYTLSRLS